MSTRQRGVTLVELVISITIVGIAAGAALGVLSLLSMGSAEALARHQAVAIGNAYLEEALLKSFADPDGVDGEAARASFDDVDDFHGLDDDGARDQFGVALSGLAAYRVTMSVQNGTLGSITSASGNALRVDVVVRHPAGVAMTFSGYRARY
jgi:MSHA pilin protein MshD